MTKKFDERATNGEKLKDERPRKTCERCKGKFLWLRDGKLCEDCFEKVR